ncbi:type IV pilus modification PilV family protein [Shewanella sp.]|uniref:type IV pilus modification PilV family protein n=1 Tax=Shewanella sp. TaxID=50422 RepID=UPI003A96F692
MIWLSTIERMDMPPFTAKQRGFSLISLMIGVLVTSFALLAMMALYKSAVFHIYNPNSGSETFSIRNQQNMSGLLTMQSVLQNAGFGISDATTSSQFLLVAGVALVSEVGSSALLPAGTPLTINHSVQEGNAVFWEENSGLSDAPADYICRGLLSDSTSFAVYQLVTSGNCHPIANQWANKTWTVTRIIKPNVLTGAVRFEVSINPSKCSPFDSELPSSMLPSLVSSLAGLKSDAATKAGLQVDLNWSQSVSYTPWRSCLINFSH